MSAETKTPRKRDFLDGYIRGKRGEWYFDIDQSIGLCGGMFYRKREARIALEVRVAELLNAANEGRVMVRKPR